MSKTGQAFMKEQAEQEGIDLQDVAYWNCYTSLKEVLTQEAYMKYYGNGDYESFCKAIDEMNEEG